MLLDEGEASLEPLGSGSKTGEALELSAHRSAQLRQRVNSLLKSRGNVVERPGSRTQVSSEGVSEIVGAHDGADVGHPALQTAVHERVESWNSVRSVSAHCNSQKMVRHSVDVPASFSSPSERYSMAFKSTISSPLNASSAPSEHVASRSCGSPSIHVANTITLAGGNTSGTIICEYAPFSSVCDEATTAGRGLSVEGRPLSVVAVLSSTVEVILIVDPVMNLTPVPYSLIGSTAPYQCRSELIKEYAPVPRSVPLPEKAVCATSRYPRCVIGLTRCEMMYCILIS